MKRSRKSRLGLSILVTLLTILPIAWLIFRGRQLKAQSLKSLTPKDVTTRMFNLINRSWKGNIPVEYLVAQSMLETGDFTSNIFYKNNNLFGMKFPTKRPTTAKYENLGYAYYASLEDSIKDLILWMQYVNFPGDLTAVGEYVSALAKKKYFEADEFLYEQGVQRELSTLSSFNLIPKYTGGAGGSF